MSGHIFTSESVTEGHPDKISDQISDAILDALLELDPKSRVACETLVKTGYVNLAGEITTNANIDYTAIVRNTIRGIGYTNSEMGFDADTCAVRLPSMLNHPTLHRVLMKVKATFKRQMAGDQGLMFGFACSETPELMPLPIALSHKLTAKLSEVRKNGTLPYLRPDGKSRVSIEYQNDKPIRISAVVISTQHNEEMASKMNMLREDIKSHVIDPVLPEGMIDSETQFFINPTGKFVIGGPMGDCGLTGRKIIVDTYGGMGRHGGGAFSGKDPSKS